MTAGFIQGDIFQLPLKKESIDVVFNAGVLEHFDFSQRCLALREMERVVRPGGSIIVAVPNHFSAPYRYAYKYLNKKKQWPYPEEYAVYDLEKDKSFIVMEENIDFPK